MTEPASSLLERRLSRASTLSGDFLFLQTTAPRNPLLDKLCAASHLASRLHAYAAVRGDAKLRRLIAEKRTADASGDCVLVTHGALHALNLIFRACRGRCRVAVCPAPIFRGVAEALRAYGYHVILLAEERFVERLPEVLAAGETLVVLTSPSSPLGNVLGPAELGVVLDACRAARAPLVVDTVYSDFSRRGSRTKALRPTLEQLHDLYVVDSLSKNYGAPGLRVGWVVTTEANVEPLAGAMESDTISVSPYAQQLACRLLEAGNAPLVELVQQRQLDVPTRLSALANVKLQVPAAGTQLCLELGEADVEAFADYALEQHRLLLATSNLFVGARSPFFRFPLCLTAEETTLALTRLAQALDEFGRAWRPAWQTNAC